VDTGHHWGGDFTQWTGSLLQKRGFDEIRSASAFYHRTKRDWERAAPLMSEPEAARELIHQAYDRLLNAETSCNFFWGSSWVHRAFDEIEQCYFLLDQARKMMPKEALAEGGGPAGSEDPR
jgi:alpha-amylase/alpha-mannosidase (GH57 family)